MLIKTTRVTKAIDYTADHEAYINPYYGCTAGCPFCYWLSFEGWENKIEVRENLPELLEAALSNGIETGRLFIGSYCDPYMDGIEDVHGLTRACLEVLARYEIPVTVVSSVRSGLILRDLDLLRSIKDLAVVTELCRPDQIELLRSGKESVNISVANELNKEGIAVFATLSPILPGITDLNEVLRRLDTRIPVYVDTLDIQKGSIQEERVFAYLRENYPELEPVYEEYVKDRVGNLARLMENYSDNSRVRRFPIFGLGFF